MKLYNLLLIISIILMIVTFSNQICLDKRLKNNQTQLNDLQRYYRMKK